MYNKRLVVSYLSLLAIQQIVLALFVYLGLTTDIISPAGLLLWWGHIIIIVDVIFFVLVMIFQWEQVRYIVLGISSIIVSVTYLFVLFNYIGGTNIPYMGDINIVAIFVLLLVTGYIMVDDTTYSFVKWIMFGNLVILILFRTPLFLLLVAIIQQFFQSTDILAFDVWIWMFAIHSLLVLGLGIFKAYMMNRIDFL